jgi:MSHA biogenesis protein MshN
MSLLNDMLQGLQQQPDKDNATGDENNRAQLKASGMIKTTSVPWRASLLIFIGVLVTLLLLKQQFIQVLDTGKADTPLSLVTDEQLSPAIVNPPQETPVAAVAEITDTLVIDHNSDVDHVQSLRPQSSKPQALIEQTVIQDEQISAAEIVGQPALKPLQPEQQAQIDQLLTRARQALARDRLTSPFEDNAYTYYQQVLAIEPENALASQGILQLADRYLAMADKRLSTGNNDAANRLLQRAQLVAPYYEAVIAFAESFPMDFQQANSIVEPLANSDPANEANAHNGDERAPEKSVSVSIQDPFNAIVETSHLSVTPNAQWQDQEQAQQAQLLLQQGKPAQAMSLLENFIASNDHAKYSVQMLLDIYCQQGRIEDAQRLLASATHLEKVDQHYYKARLALMNNQGQEAMDLLEAELPMAEKHEQYRALLAGLYQKMAYYPQAAANYKRLLEVFGEKPAYWLGYALALDALEQKASALQAYRRLSEYTELQAEVRHYIEQRIAALQG